MTEPETRPVFAHWAIVEILGHQVIAGFVTEQQIADRRFVRVDVPADGSQEAFTRFVGTSSIYAITPTTEDTVNQFVKRWVTPAVMNNSFRFEGVRLPAAPPIAPGEVVQDLLRPFDGRPLDGLLEPRADDPDDED